MNQKTIRGRFAPSPSGRMHLGNLFAALLAWLDVRAAGGEMLLRMEDLDPQRCRPAYAAQLADDLRWLGLDWDLGWQPGQTQYQQSSRTAHYAAAFQRLEEQGLLYPCYCNRRERLAAGAPHAADGTLPYSGHCRDLTKAETQNFLRDGRRAAWRIRVPAWEISMQDDVFGIYAQRLDQSEGDFILRRSDGVYAYQLAVVVDDGAMGVNRVVRGSDLLGSTPRQLWLMELLGITPPSYAHLPLLTDEMGRRLSKRDRDLDVGVLRQNVSPQKLTGFLAYQAGILPRVETVEPRELVKDFAWEHMGTQDRCVTASMLHRLFD